MYTLQVTSILLFSITLEIIPGNFGNLLAEEVNDGPCLSWSELLPHFYSGANVVPVIPPGDYFVPMGSKAMYRQYAEGLLGRPAENQLELDSMQLLFQCGILFSHIINTGFPHMENPPRFAQTCISGALPSFPNIGLMTGNFNLDYIQAVCVGLPALRPDGSMAWSPSPSFVSTMDSIIWVNEDSTVLLTYRCPSDGFKDFKVMSKNKTLNYDDHLAIKTKVIEMGFNKQNIAYMRYE